MESVFQSPGESLIACCIVAWGFFFIAWFLERPFIMNGVGQQITYYNKLPKDKLDALLSGIHIRAVGGVHNTIQVLLALYALTDAVLWNDTWHAVTPLSEIVVVISAGFFLWDIAVSIRRASQDGTEFIMHGALCFAFYLYISLSRNYHFYGCGFVLWEMSTPFVHLRWLIYKIGRSHTKLYLYNGLLMIISFGLCRICWGGYLGMRFFLSSLEPQTAISPITIWALRGVCVALNALNWHWFRLMLGGAIHMVINKTTPQAEERRASANGEKKKS